MQIYLPIAEVSVNAFLLLGLGGLVGVLSGMFGVGGGFLLTPFLFFIGIVFYTLFKGERVNVPNYWNEHADTLEWTLPSPPPEHTFETLPKREDWDRSHAH